MNGSPALKYWRPGFDDPALGSQQTFRAIFAAMEHPGRLVTIRENPEAPDVLNSASAATCLTLLACETPVWTDVERKSPAISWLQFGCGGAVVTESCMANFAIVTKPATVPWEKLIRTKSIPARIKLSIADSSSVAGPNVAIIFVRLSIVGTPYFG
jgi:alpha-D-ribose 1-methylphosphonate 5-triphosphate synthase subunit PhnH